MIDLRVKGLPNVIKIGGKPYSIHTDFRYWLEFYDLITHNDLEELTNKDFLFLFKNDVPIFQDFFEELINFFVNPNATPNGNGGSSEQMFDYILDGEYIYASFMQVYGIDLTSVNMHWHKFKALFISLPDYCKMRNIMAYRGYEKETKKYEQLAKERKEEWTLPRKESKIDEKIMESINEEFYNS